MDKKYFYIVNLLLALSFIIVFLTGIVKWPELTRYFTGLYRVISPNTITLLHDWSGAAMGFFVLIHLILHWKWIVKMTRKIFGGKNDERNKL